MEQTYITWGVCIFSCTRHGKYSSNKLYRKAFVTA